MNILIPDPTVKTKYLEREVISAEDFYISFNPMTDNGPETAVCHRTKEPAFRILEGCYLPELKPLVEKGYDAVMQKFQELVDGGAVISKWSD